MTGKRTMIYMAVSLAFIAGGILIAYLLEGVEPHRGKTLNAVLFEQLTARWRIGGLNLGALGRHLYAADRGRAAVRRGADRFRRRTAGAGDDGGRSLGAAPLRKSERAPGHAGRRACDGYRRGGDSASRPAPRSSFLVVLYAINVFVTFTLSQLGMSRLWWRERATEPKWIRKLLVNGIGCLFTATILFLTVTLKFNQGGWITVAMTGSVAAACYLVRRHYERVAIARSNGSKWKCCRNSSAPRQSRLRRAIPPCPPRS